MKKMMLCFFTGCMMIGLGLGVTFLEIKDWKTADICPDIMKMPRETYTKIIDFDTDNKKEVDVVYSQPNKTFDNIKVIKDTDCTDVLKIEVAYRGALPEVYPSVSGGNQRQYYWLWVDTSGSDDIKTMFELWKSMFENKTYYHYSNVTYIEDVTLYTAHPEKIELSLHGMPITDSVIS